MGSRDKHTKDNKMHNRKSRTRHRNRKRNNKKYWKYKYLAVTMDEDRKDSKDEIKENGRGTHD